MKDSIAILLFLAGFIIVLIVNQIYISLKVKKAKKKNLICPECGEKLKHEVFDIELDSKEARVGTTHFTNGVKYYHVMTCPKCYYTIKLDDIL